ncbi:acyl-CoA thioester hydrolase [Arboricoccus pini]|uniref:Acyl-CoA thioester hydrolase n=1 Tax=Arboricoccus pini TaxID=1963835 RepID=A0A212QTH1_9PROT|nr:tol-pal system-associated acyl-CoA thioesterase [Arboricoccus pini]SNB62755.1 acyl-CoA thioester hydrolase [Arboricoccus pini]
MPDRVIHRLEVRVYYEDTDAGGIVYHASYLRFAERARTEFLRSLGMDHAKLLADYGGFFVVTRIEIDFRRPGLLDDILEVETGIASTTKARLSMLQTIRRDHDVLAEMQVTLAFLSRKHRPLRLPNLEAPTAPQ